MSESGPNSAIKLRGRHGRTCFDTRRRGGQLMACVRPRSHRSSAASPRRRVLPSNRPSRPVTVAPATGPAGDIGACAPRKSAHILRPEQEGADWPVLIWRDGPARGERPHLCRRRKRKSSHIHQFISSKARVHAGRQSLGLCVRILWRWPEILQCSVRRDCAFKDRVPNSHERESCAARAREIRVSMESMALDLPTNVYTATTLSV
jgi:hypothetical protein